MNYYLSDGFAEYFAFQFTADKRFSQGVSALLGYAYSHAIDDVPLEFGGGNAGPNPQDPRFPHEVSNSIIDQRTRLTLSYLWAFRSARAKMDESRRLADIVLGGWQMNGILFTQSGLWFSPVLQTSTTNTGTSSRPNLIPGARSFIPRRCSTGLRPSAFASPAQYLWQCGPQFPGRARKNKLRYLAVQELHDPRTMILQFRAGSVQRVQSPTVQLPECVHRQRAGRSDHINRRQRA